MDKDSLVFKDNVDAWVKQIRSEVNDISDVSGVVEENVNNIQHNYELVLELKDKVEELKQEITALKFLQVAALRKKLNKNT